MKGALVAVALVAAALAGSFVGGCRTRAEDDPSTSRVPEQPAMPRGMLVPAPEAIAASTPDSGPRAASDIASRLTTTRSKPSGAAVEVRVPGGAATFVPLEAVTLLNDALARAKPGYVPLLAQRFEGDELARLDSELAAFESAWLGVVTSGDAKARWARTSELVRTLEGETSWKDAQRALVDTIRILRAEIAGARAEGQGLELRYPG